MPGTRLTFSEHVPIYVHTYFIRHSVAEYATQKSDWNLIRLSSCVRAWPARHIATSGEILKSSKAIKITASTELAKTNPTMIMDLPITTLIDLIPYLPVIVWLQTLLLAHVEMVQHPVSMQNIMALHLNVNWTQELTDQFR